MYECRVELLAAMPLRPMSIVMIGVRALRLSNRLEQRSNPVDQCGIIIANSLVAHLDTLGYTRCAPSSAMLTN